MKNKIKKIINGWWKWLLLLIIPVAFAAPPMIDFFTPEGVNVYTACDISKPVRLSVADSLTDLRVKKPDNSFRILNAKEKGSLKGCEISKLGSIPRIQRVGYDIEIVSMNPIEKGVEMFVRAWDVNGQIGFGREGTVDIERFVIINPPILVDDPNGNIIRPGTGDIVGRKLREDLQESLLQVLEHTIKVKQQKFGSEKIVTGKKGNTTSTFFPAAGLNSPIDGYCGREPTSENLGTIRAGAGTFASDTSAEVHYTRLRASATTDEYDNLYRGIVLFDTSSISTDDTIDSATQSLFTHTSGKNNGLSGEASANSVRVLMANTPGDDADLVSADYGQFGTTDFGRGAQQDAITEEAYDDITVNSSGLSDIAQGSGLTRWGHQYGWDFDNTETGLTWSSGGIQSIVIRTADTAGTSSDPKLVVEHSVARGGIYIVQ